MNKTALILIAVAGAGLLITGSLVFIKNYSTSRSQERSRIYAQIVGSMPGNLHPDVIKGWCGELGYVPSGTISAVAAETVAPTLTTPTPKVVKKVVKLATPSGLVK